MHVVFQCAIFNNFASLFSAGHLNSIRQLKEEVERIKKGVECGLMFQESSVSLEEGDIIHCGEYVERVPEFEWDLDFWRPKGGKGVKVISGVKLKAACH